MPKSLTVQDQILIKAPSSSVWEVLVEPEYVTQWDELPEDYPSETMTEGSQVIWENPNGGQTVTTIIKADQHKELKIALFLSSWAVKPEEGDVAYIYQLEEQTGGTLLKITIGDFSLLEDGQKYYDASVEFAAESKVMIKELAEKIKS